MSIEKAELLHWSSVAQRSDMHVHGVNLCGAGNGLFNISNTVSFAPKRQLAFQFASCFFLKALTVSAPATDFKKTIKFCHGIAA